MIDYISLIIVLFIATCALLWMCIYRRKFLIAGAPIRKGSLVCMSNGYLYEASDDTTMPLGICIAVIDEMEHKVSIQAEF